MSKKKKAKEWIRKNWKWLAVGAGTIGLGVIKIVLDSSTDNRQEEYLDYNDRWLKSATDDELDTEREKIRVLYCSSGGDFDEACRLEKLLWRFDSEMSNRAWGDEKPHAPSYHREHGYYLPNDD